MDTREPKGGFVAHAFVDVAFEHGGDRAAGSMVHPVTQLEVADRELRLVDVMVQRVERRLVQAVVLRELGVEPFQRIEVASLIRVVERFPEIQIPETVVRRPGRRHGRDMKRREH